MFTLLHVEFVMIKESLFRDRKKSENIILNLTVFHYKQLILMVIVVSALFLLLFIFICRFACSYTSFALLKV